MYMYNSVCMCRLFWVYSPGWFNIPCLRLGDPTCWWFLGSWVNVPWTPWTMDDQSVCINFRLNTIHSNITPIKPLRCWNRLCLCRVTQPLTSTVLYIFILKMSPCVATLTPSRAQIQWARTVGMRPEPWFDPCFPMGMLKLKPALVD